MDSGPSRHGHFGARDGSPPRVGCAATNRTAALRRRLAGLRIGGGIGPSGSRLGCPSDDERTVWPETGSPACWSTPEPRAAKGDLRVPTARRSIGVLRDFRPRGSNAAPFGARGSGAQTTSPPGVDVRGERALRHVRARAPKDAEQKLEPPVPLFGASTGSRTSLFGDASRSRRQPSAFGRWTDAVDPPPG